MTVPKIPPGQPQPEKVPVSEGRARLEAAHFTSGDVGCGNRGEIWIRNDGFPAFITYVGPPYGEFFSKESLDRALNGP